ncbi:MAG: HlyD family efflux transporter periplasmic adaptor subunit [Eubacterium sp.]|nr:HlyD family efflux transporter periplasmic adaptor subunit [Eubacterium sp.]
MPKIKKKQGVLLILIIAVLIVITEAMPKVISSVTPTITIEYGNLRVEDEVDVYVLRDETVYLANEDATIEYKVNEGKQLKSGSRVISYDKKDQQQEVDPLKKEVADRLGKKGVLKNSGYASRKGVFSTYVDGWENYFKADNFNEFTKETVESRSEDIKDIKNKSVLKYQPMYKITDQSKWYLVCWIHSEDISKYSIGKTVDIDFGSGDVRFVIENIKEDGEEWKLLLSSNRYYKEFNQKRKISINMVTMDINGILIPNKSITTRDGKVGVYVINKTGDSVFTEIKAYGSDGETTVCAENIFYDAEGNLVETVKGFDEILKNPAHEKVEKKGA